MPRAEVGTQKWLANKMKAKGLQKLRWYCQMCEKQCRDENGFKCHRMSEGHQRQMQVFSQNPDRFMDEFSLTFEKNFMKLMKTRYCRTRVLANTVYTEMIADKEHVHMNSTIWVTLTEFVQYLSHSGKCKIDYTPKGWFLEYIDREKIERERQERLNRKRERTMEEINERRIKDLVDEAEKQGKYQKTDYIAKDRLESEKISIGGLKKRISDESNIVGKNILMEEFKIVKSTKHETTSTTKSSSTTRPKLSAIDELMLKNEEKKRMKEIADKKQPSVGSDVKREEETQTTGWVMRGLIVKIVDKQFMDGQYYKQKGLVHDVDTRCVATLKLLGENQRIKISQDGLETVIPNIGGPVRIVSGRWQGVEGTLMKVDFEEYCASVKCNDTGKYINSLQFEEICKVGDQSE